jgi:hypothetical protein
LNTLVGEGGWHSDVQDHDVGTADCHCAVDLVGVYERVDHLVPFGLE